MIDSGSACIDDAPLRGSMDFPGPSANGPELVRISASAGAGKTFSLSIRYLTLLKRQAGPSSKALQGILAITFTNKAAQEMRQRILGHLKTIALERDGHELLRERTGLSPREARQWIEVILKHFSDFKVRTVDSLLFSILKAFSFEKDIGPDPRVTFNQKDFWDDVFDLLLSRISHGNRDCLVLFERALNAYFTMDEWGGFYPESGLRHRIYELLDKVKDHPALPEDSKKAEQRLKSAGEGLMAAYQDLLKHVEAVKGALNKTYGRMLLPVKGPGEIPGKSIIKGEEVPSTLFKKKVKLEQAEKDAFLAALRVVKDRAAEYRELQSIYRLSGYVDLINELKGVSDELCKARGIILGSDHWTRVVDSIVNDPALLPLVFLHLGYRLDHFLFDEFQDTSRSQWQALRPILEESLSRGGSLFLVGDVKQAIYGWRGGDMGLFHEVISGECGLPQVEKVLDITLCCNYRSHPCLVRFFNELFAPLSDRAMVFESVAGPILGANTPVSAKEYLAERLVMGYEGHGQKSPETIPAGEEALPPRVLIREITGGKDQTTAFIRARFIEDIRQEWDTRSQWRTGQGGSAPIACLVRSHSHAEIVSQWLMQEGIPVVTENAFRLEASRLVKGIVCLFRLIMDRRNQVALHGLLASGILPFVPASEEEVTAAWMNGQLHQWQSKLDELLAELFSTQWIKGPYILLADLDTLLGISERIHEEFPHEAPFFERLKEVIHNFEISEGRSLKKFLEYWDAGGAQERVGLPAYMDAVHVMTIHKAKGLEFPVVYIPFTNWYIRDRTPIRVIEGRLVRLDGGVRGEYREMRGRILADEVMENINLLYVAVTRAVHRLYLNVTIPEGGGAKPISIVLKNLVNAMKTRGPGSMDGVLWESHVLR